ncbi:hypothetical protein HOO68_03990 [Candidatus Gracilibacteria bacterium]|nr:hypothetical protein [Candidatus Gracilibacteria bacterium]
MHLDTSSDPYSPTQALGGNHIYGYLQHAGIRQEMSRLDSKEIYYILEISPNGDTNEYNHTGTEIKKDYSNIFGKYLHAFIVRKGSKNGEISFIYTGPIAKRVDSILGTHIIH